MSNLNQEQMRAWFAKNRTAVLVGCGVAALLVVAGSATEGNSPAQPPQPCMPGQQGCTPQPNGQDGGGGPRYGDGGGNPDYGGAGGGSGGGTDMDEWRRREAASDEAQRERIRTIREEEKCRRSDGTTDEVSIHTGC